MMVEIALGVHVCHLAVVLRDDVIRVGAARRQPARDVVAERLEGHDLVQRVIVWVGLVAVVEHALIGRGRQVGRVRVHVAEEEQEGLLALRQPLQLRHGDLVKVLRLGHAALVPRLPARVEVQVLVEPARGRVVGEADAGARVARVAQYFGQRPDFRPQRALVRQRDDLRAEHIHAGEHVGVAARRRDVRAVVVLEERGALRKPVDVRRRQPVIAVRAHVVRAQRVDAEEQDIGKFVRHVTSK